MALLKMASNIETWKGPTHREVTVADAQLLFDRQGGAREKRAPVASVHLLDGTTNLLGAYDANGKHLGTISFQPYDWRLERPDSTDSLQISG